MLQIALTAKNSRKYRFSLGWGQDFLLVLDKFLKRNKLDVLGFRKIEVFCDNDGSTVCRTSIASAAAIRFVIESTSRK